jgi:hypothetical protein
MSELMEDGALDAGLPQRAIEAAAPRMAADFGDLVHKDGDAI